MNMESNSKHIGEILLVCFGFTLLLSLPVIVLTGSFFVWVFAKALYVIGVALFVFNR